MVCCPTYLQIPLTSASLDPIDFCPTSVLQRTLHLRVTLLTSTTCLSRLQTPFPVDREARWFRDITCSTSLFSICPISETYNFPNYLNRSAWARAWSSMLHVKKSPLTSSLTTASPLKMLLDRLGNRAKHGVTSEYLCCVISLPAFFVPLKLLTPESIHFWRSSRHNLIWQNIKWDFSHYSWATVLRKLDFLYLWL